MAVVTEYLFQLIAKQVEDRGLVVWYDPERVYSTAAAELALPNTTIARYDGSYLKLRHRIDHLMNDSQPPRLVVYVPVDRDQTHDALVELEEAGVVMKPRQQPPNCNTRLSVVARNALRADRSAALASASLMYSRSPAAIHSARPAWCRILAPTRAAWRVPCRVMTGTPIHSASQVVVVPL